MTTSKLPIVVEALSVKLLKPTLLAVCPGVRRDPPCRKYKLYKDLDLLHFLKPEDVYEDEPRDCMDWMRRSALATGAMDGETKRTRNGVRFSGGPVTLLDPSEPGLIRFSEEAFWVYVHDGETIYVMTRLTGVPAYYELTPHITIAPFDVKLS